MSAHLIEMAVFLGWVFLWASVPVMLLAFMGVL